MGAGHAYADERLRVARACRVMAMRGLVEDILGHISLRVDEPSVGHALLRCRGPHERGLRFTTPHDIRLVDLDGRFVEPDDGYALPNEAPLHLETLRRHPEAGAVVHAHPPAVVALSGAGIDLTPVFGAYDIPAARLAATGIPTYPRAVLIRTTDLAHDLLDSMGAAPVCVLAGHGLVTIGADEREAVLRALAADRLARVALTIRQAGGTLRTISPADLAELPDLGAGFNQDTLWRFHLSSLAAEGWDVAARDR